MAQTDADVADFPNFEIKWKNRDIFEETERGHQRQRCGPSILTRIDRKVPARKSCINQAVAFFHPPGMALTGNYWSAKIQVIYFIKTHTHDFHKRQGTKDVATGVDDISALIESPPATESTSFITCCLLIFIFKLFVNQQWPSFRTIERVICGPPTHISIRADAATGAGPAGVFLNCAPIHFGHPH